MAAFQPSPKGHPAHPPPSQRSFLDALSGKSGDSFNPKQPRVFRGKPHVHFDADDVQRYSKPFTYALIGKFTKGRPNLERLRKIFISIGFTGTYNIGLIDYKHIIIRFSLEEDYTRCFLKRVWTVDGFVMRVLKWHYKFSIDAECSIVPVWVNFPLLPLHLFNKEALYSIARLIGEPLKLGASTTTFNRPSVARVCVEIDLMQDRIGEVWITQDDYGFWQKVEYDDLPSYCKTCNKVGHNSDVCRQDASRGTSDSAKNKEAPSLAAQPRLQWLRKQPNIEQQSIPPAPATPAVVMEASAATTLPPPSSSSDGPLAPTENAIITSSQGQDACRVAAPLQTAPLILQKPTFNEQIRIEAAIVATPSTIKPASVPTVIVERQSTLPTTDGRSTSVACLAASLPAAPSASSLIELSAQPHAEVSTVLSPTETAAAGTSHTSRDSPLNYAQAVALQQPASNVVLPAATFPVLSAPTSPSLLSF